MPAATALGAGLATAFAPFDQVVLAPAAVAGLVLLLRGLPARSGLLLGFVFGLGYLLALTWWLRMIGVDAWVLVSLLAACHYALLGWGAVLLLRLPGWPVWVAMWWTGVEVLQAAWPLGGFPWARLAWVSVDTPWASWLPLTGSNGVSLLIAGTGTTLAWALSRVAARPILTTAVAATVGGVLLVPSVIEPASLTPGWEEDRPMVTVAVVQGDVPGDGDELVKHHRQVTRNHVEATEDLGAAAARGALPRPDFVLWPENATAVDPFADPEARDGIAAAARAVGVPVVVGAMVDGPTDAEVLNQGIVWTPEGPQDRYTKRHPVPFGEYVPFRGVLSLLGIGRLDQVPRDMIAGTSTEPLSVAGVRVGTVICFDVAFDDSVLAQVRSGAQLVTVQTSNAMFITTSQIDQQFQISRVRAMETGRTVVVAATNGLTGVIGPDGTVRASVPPRTTSVLVEDVALLDATTPGTALSIWIGRAALVVSGIAILTAVLANRLAGWRRRRTR